MTIPPTPAGWYPDPDGSGGQRYWDGSTWTEHRSPAAQQPAEPTDHAEPAGSEQPTTVVPLLPAGEHAGAHRAPEPDAEPPGWHEAEPPGWHEAEPPSHEPQPSGWHETEPPSHEPQPPGWHEPEPGVTTAFDPVSSAPSEQTTSVIPRSAAFLGEPPAGEAVGDPAAHDRRRKDMVLFGVTCSVLMVVLIAVVIYAVFLHKDKTFSASSGPKSTTASAAPSTTSASDTATPSESPAPASGSGAQATDGAITFAVTGTETAASVKSQDAPVEQTAQGQYVIVHLTVSDTGDQPATFVATFQKLEAGSTAYSIDDVATAYLNGTTAQLNPGDKSNVSIAFDVPAGTTPDSLKVQSDPTSAGAEIPLS